MTVRTRKLIVCFATLLAWGASSTHAQDKPDPKSEIGGLKSKFVDVDGVLARYYEAGQGEPRVMVHGGFNAGSSTANVFSRNIPSLAKHFHIYAVDRWPAVCPVTPPATCNSVIKAMLTSSTTLSRHSS
jgi:hypothetical protein